MDSEVIPEPNDSGFAQCGGIARVPGVSARLAEAIVVREGRDSGDLGVACRRRSNRNLQGGAGLGR